MYECKWNKLKQCKKYNAESFQFEQKLITFNELKQHYAIQLIFYLCRHRKIFEQFYLMGNKLRNDTKSFKT